MSSLAAPTSRLPDGWSDPERVADQIEIDGVKISRAGVAARAPSGEEVTGSAAAADDDASGVAARAWFELLERVVTLEAIAQPAQWTVRGRDGEARRPVPGEDLFPVDPEPGRWRHSRSNAVALHATWDEACRRAELELVERHRVLEAWLGRAGRERVANAEHPIVARARVHEWVTLRLLPSPGCFSSGIEVSMVAGFAREGGPMAVGFGASTGLSDAVRTATREAVQMLSFLWGEPVNEEPSAATTDAMHHLEHYQTTRGQRILRAWMTRAAPAAPGSVGGRGGQVAFVDLSPSWLKTLHVVKAIHPGALPLTFGESPHMQSLPSERRVHPIP